MSQEAVDEPSPTALPEPVRARVLTLAADALGRMPEGSLPPSLKRVASFAPNRRARLAGRQIAAALENDAEFRTSLAVQVRAAEPELSTALESGNPPAAADPTELAALAYLLRPEGWVSVVDAAERVDSVDRVTAVEQRYKEQVDRLQGQLDGATQDLKAARQGHREEVARLKAENTELRRKLGDARSRLKAAEAAVDDASREVAEAQKKAGSAAAATDAEVRRLRSRIEELEAALGERRRTERAERGAGDMRARLLLDTMLESVQGLRRELAIPAVESTPAEMVEADLAEKGFRASSGHGSLAVGDPARLDQLLALPRSHLIVDGYNVTMNSWPELSLEQQRDRLVGGLAPLAARTSAEVTVVFDAAEKQQRPLVNRPRGVRVLFSPVGVIADDVIRELVAAEPRGRPVVVVTDDQAVVRDVTKAGARPAGAAALTGLLNRG